jgi:beta-xylosidase
LAYKKPDVGKVYPVAVPQTSDEFASPTMGLQWQWAANFHPEWYSLSARPGWLRLFGVPKPNSAKNLLGVPNVILQKLPAPEFTVTTKLDFDRLTVGDIAGLVILGRNHYFAAIKRTSTGPHLIRISNEPVMEDTQENDAPWTGSSVFLRLRVDNGASCDFSYSSDGKRFSPIGKPFHALPGGWAGARIGLFCLATAETNQMSYVDVDWFRLEK